MAGKIRKLANGAYARVLANGKLKFISKSAAKAARSSSSTSSTKKPRRAKARTARKRVNHMAKKKKGGYGRKRMNPDRLVRGVAAAAGAAIAAEPVVEQALGPLMNGDLAGAGRGAIQGLKESATPQRMIAAATPSLVAEVVIGARRLVKSVPRWFRG